jgi:hypothetical protein
MIIVFILLIVAIILWAGFELFHIFEQGTPAKDSDILEMLQDETMIFQLEKRRWDGKFRLSPDRFNTPDIVQTTSSILFPYYINDVGVVPVWYKSARVLNQMFKEKIAASNYTITKRDKLGLGK